MLAARTVARRPRRDDGIQGRRCAGGWLMLTARRRSPAAPAARDEAARAPERWIGRALRRVEDERLVPGGGRFVDDLGDADCLHLAFLRANCAGARIDRDRPCGRSRGRGRDRGLRGRRSRQARRGRGQRAPADLKLAPFRPWRAAISRPSASPSRASSRRRSRRAGRDRPHRTRDDASGLAPGLGRGRSLPASLAPWRCRACLRIGRNGREDPHRPCAPRADALKPRAAQASFDEATGELAVWLSTQTPHRARSGPRAHPRLAGGRRSGSSRPMSAAPSAARRRSIRRTPWSRSRR